ncbi:MAG TPA: MBL fold metallo-hydrolase, partial [Steroidobacteraceae bacterium]|nr:MBL fold metallo-hydrolase [Steroidobacteraceae bacterium]
MPISRRLFLRSGAQALSAASLLGVVPGLAAATQPDHKSVSAHDISVTDVSGLAVFAGGGCNVVGLAGPDGALLIDGGLAVNSAVLLKAVAENLKTRRVNTLINTHWHPEQTGSNEAVGKAGGTIISHQVSRLALGRKERSALYEG